MTIKGYFNESCSICRAEINHYKKINNSIDWVDVINNKDALNETKLSSEDLIRRLPVSYTHLRDHETVLDLV